MEFIYPREMDRIFIPRQLDGTPGEVVFQLTHRNPASEIHWFLDNTFVGKTSVYHRISLNPPPGAHNLTVTDMEGNQVIKRFTLIDK
jgi:penicillin-binding protein 1C